MLYHLYRVCLFDKVCMTRSWHPREVLKQVIHVHLLHVQYYKNHYNFRDIQQSRVHIRTKKYTMYRMAQTQG